jgi:stress response protein YsnF
MVPSTSDEQSPLSITEEVARVDKHIVDRSTVRLETRTEAIERVLSEQLADDEVEIERVSIGHEVKEAPRVRTEGDVTIVPVVREEVRVEKYLVLVEEIHLRRRTRTKNVEIPVELRRQSVVVSRLPPQANSEEADQ